MPFLFMIRLMRRRDSVTPSCPRAWLDLPGPVHLAAVPPHALHILLVRVGAFGLGVFEHPVVGRLGNAQDPALR